MKNFRYLLILLASLSIGRQAIAQSITIHTKNGVPVNLPYEKIDSLVAFSSHDESPELSQATGSYMGYEYVDLGLSVM